MFNIKLLWLNVSKNKFGTLMIMLLTGLSVALSVTVNLQERAFREGSARAAERFDLVIGGLGSETQLVLSTVFLQPSPLPLIDTQNLTALEADSRVKWVAPLALGDFTKGMPIIGTSKVFVTDGGEKEIQGRLFERDFEAAVGARTGYQIGDKFSPIHGQVGESGSHSHSDIEYEVVGVLPEDHSIWDTAILVPIETIWEVHAHHQEGQQSGEHTELHHHSPFPIKTKPTHINQIPEMHEHSELGVSAIIVKPTSFSAAYQLRSEYRNSQTQALFPAEVLVKVYGVLGDSKEVLSWIAVVMQILIGIALMMIITLYLKQQQKQIAAWRIFGAPRHKILWLVWSSLLLLITLSIILGAILGYIATLLISQHISLKSGFALPVSFTLEDVSQLFLILSISVIFALIPSLMLYAQSPVKILQERD
ncbi:putative ABC transport system permease protein [Pasteurella langaaensis DSM 22999]|uniref:Putative ABC transport system permease protein n=1 Tax=Alitibacter langaaensis DSM 22999 TaxID=1122935 RepID=A0A2U0SQ13_9PAST|nr:FtsX-like permease family protein [Pasteurella langaaensis]PVX33443.1 putative ABC transport system permease protein [Pasteurella langaaensis DSM 22999]